MRRESLKIEKWTAADKVKNFIVYFANALILGLLFIMTVYLNDVVQGKAKEFSSYIIDIKTTIRFFILLIMIVVISFIYFTFEDKNFLKNAVNSQMLFLIIEVSYVLCFVIGQYVNMYLRPFALAALLVLFLKDRRSAIFVNVLFCMIVFMTDTFNVQSGDNTVAYFALLSGFASGMIAIFYTGKVFSRLALIQKSLLISIPALICGAVTLFADTDQVLTTLICSACSGPFAIASFILLLPVFESMFKKVSCFKFAELTDHKSKLIRKMIDEAPGTFNHSIIVSNIAEACATAIGEDALFARTCAYYHDIGKLRRPEFFAENQPVGTNPHDDLTPELSTNIIKSHTLDGYQLVLKSGLPKEIADVCLQHHGTLPILFFYDKAKKFTDGEVNIEDFCYQGPKPQSKIAAIIMIADSCEAATRSLKDRSRENVKKVVREIVNNRMSLGQFDECELTLKETNIIIHTVVNNLTGIYHGRVEYPKVDLDSIKER